MSGPSKYRVPAQRIVKVLLRVSVCVVFPTVTRGLTVEPIIEKDIESAKEDTGRTLSFPASP